MTVAVEHEWTEPTEQDTGELTDDERIDEQGRQSFPCSDAPSWTSGIGSHDPPTPARGKDAKS